MNAPLRTTASSAAESFDSPSVAPVVRLVAHESQPVAGQLLSNIMIQRLTPAQALRMCRHQLKWTIRGAAAHFGVAHNTWSNYELGRVTVPADALLWIVRKCEEIGR